MREFSQLSSVKMSDGRKSANPFPKDQGEKEIKAKCMDSSKEEAGRGSDEQSTEQKVLKHI